MNSKTNAERYDLHVHSSCSDGAFTPEELLYKAKEKKLSGLSITDHDIFSAYTPALAALAEKLSLKLISGIEISSLHHLQSVHILGYDFDLKAKSFHQFIKSLQAIRYERNLKILEKLKMKNIYLAEKELYPFGKAFSKGRPQIAQLLVAKKIVAGFQEAFDLYLKEGASCYIAANKFPTEKVIEEIQKAKGKAVLAHPQQIKTKKQIKSLLLLPFDGLEVYYGRLQSFQEKKWLQIAQEKKLLVTGGSDFHGLSSSSVELGSSWVDLPTLKNLLK